MQAGMRIAFLRKTNGISQAELSAKIGVRQSAISKIETGQRSLSAEEAKKIAAALGVRIDDLLGTDDRVIPASRVAPSRGAEGQGNVVPLLSLEACCGRFEAAVDDVIEWIPVPAEDFRESRYYLRARGNSMSPTIEDGELILVDRAVSPQNGDIVVAFSEEECTIKRFYRYAERIELKPDNQAFPTIVMGPQDDLEVRGVAVYVHKRLRR